MTYINAVPCKGWTFGTVTPELNQQGREVLGTGTDLWARAPVNQVGVVDPYDSPTDIY